MASTDSSTMAPEDAHAFGRALRERIDRQIGEAVNDAIRKAMEIHRNDSTVETRLNAERLARVEDTIGKIARIPTHKDMDDRIAIFEDVVDRFEKRRMEVTDDLRAARHAETRLVVLAKSLQDTMQHAETVITTIAMGFDELKRQVHDVAGRAAADAVAERLAQLEGHAKDAIAAEVQRVHDAVTAMQGEEEGPIGIGLFHGPYDPDRDEFYKRGAVVVHKGATYIAAAETKAPPAVAGAAGPWRLLQPAPTAPAPPKGKAK